MLTWHNRAATAVIVLISIVTWMFILPLLGAAALNGNPTIQIAVPAGSVYLNDVFDVVIKVSSIETTTAQIAVKFDPSVVKVVDAGGSVVLDDTASGLTQAANGGISVMATVNNTQGLVKYAVMWFNPYAAGGTGADFLSIRFHAIAPGNPNIHFATNSDPYYDLTAPSGYVIAKAGQNTVCSLVQPAVTVLNRADDALPPSVPVIFPDVVTQTKPEANTNVNTMTPETPQNNAVPVIQDKTPVLSVNFIDTGNHWAKGNIERLAASGAVRGYSDGSFKPDARITRAEFTAILAKALNLETEAAYQLGFTDINSIPLWAQPFVAAVVKRGIVGGYVDGSFRAGSLISRAEIAVMAAKALQMQGESEATLLFADRAKIPNWARESIIYTVAVDIISGYGDNTFRANSLATRAEAVTIVLRMLDYLSVGY